MNDAHLHLVLNHLPIVGLLISFLALTAGFILKNQTVKRTALALVIFASLTTIPAFYTGESAEDIVENIPSISETLIHDHEENAEYFFTLMIILGGIAAITLVVDFIDKSWSKMLYLLLFVAILYCAYVAKNVGTSGGEIRHPEIISDNKAIEIIDNKKVRTDDD